MVLTDSYYPIHSEERILNDLEASASMRKSNGLKWPPAWMSPRSHHSAGSNSSLAEMLLPGLWTRPAVMKDQLNKGMTTSGSKMDPVTTV